jgi:hypothetical protein
MMRESEPEHITAYAIWRVRKHGEYPLRLILITDDPVRHAEVRGGASPDVERWVLPLVAEQHPAELLAQVLARLDGRHVIRKGTFQSWADAVEAARDIHMGTVGYGPAGARAARYRARGQAALPGWGGEVFDPWSGREIHRTREAS